MPVTPQSPSLTREQAVAYLERSGNGCPRCLFDDVLRSEITFQDGVYLQLGECPRCALTWHDVAPLTDIVLPDANGDSVTFSLNNLTTDERTALARAIGLLDQAGQRASAEMLRHLLLGKG